MKWYIADKDYVKYLKSIDGIVQDIEYDGTIKPYIGILMQVSDYNYYIPITSDINSINKISLIR